MQNIEEFKKCWNKNNEESSATTSYDKISLQKIFKQRAKKQINISMQYFWASFTLQLIVYALLSHLIVRYWSDTSLLLISTFCMLLYIPFTVMLLKKFKQMAVLKIDETHHSGLSIHEYISQQHSLLLSFYSFKRKYEMFLIPLSSIIMIWIFFRLYLPGGVIAHPIAALLCLLLTLASCMAAIITENKKNFKRPLHLMEGILQDLKQT